MRFTSPPDPHFYHAQVWEIVSQIPAGRVATYGQIASFIPPPAHMDAKDYSAWGARWVGGAMAACPPGVPWQRVINAQGKISLRPGGGSERQKALLEAEGVMFDERERVNLRKYGWSGPSQEWLRQHNLVSPEGEAGGKLL